ncbi:hypothetical protein PR001_g9860 [Phytophthora rubi]|uniref:Integrase catalytic domain-containing protein n=1 Tax=Phytophthora rubi TaxID=129364 RepID=A0A6A3MMM7_9STRA|nr:hypothetical protein PR001_g9860 [Phytophthora rubi]
MQVAAREGFTGMANIVVELAYPLREKCSRAHLDSVQHCVAKLKAYAPGYRVIFLKSDNAAEYVGGEFAAFCDKKEIVQEFSTPYSPSRTVSCGFTEGKADTFLFVKIDGAELMIVLVYVDACSCLGRVTRRWHRSSSLWRTLML